MLLSLGMAAMGIAHLIVPSPFVRVMPAYLPYPEALVFVSGVAEIAGGVGLLVPRLRKAAGWGLVLLLAAVFPANVDMALHPQFGIPPWLLWLRLPLQIPLIVWALWASRQESGLRRPGPE